MRLENGWIICDTSKFSNFHRIQINSIGAYTYYSDDKKEDQSHAHEIRFEVNGKEIDVYYDGKLRLIDAFNRLEAIMWEHSREVTINDG